MFRCDIPKSKASLLPWLLVTRRKRTAPSRVRSSESNFSSPPPWCGRLCCGRQKATGRLSRAAESTNVSAARSLPSTHGVL